MQLSFEHLILERLLADGHGDAAWSELVVSACISVEALDATLAGGATSNARAAAPAPSTTTPPEPPGAYLASLSVESFRGIGPATALQLHPGPGLTLVIGRNGSGKSSFAEALEVLLTGTNKRWEGRSSVWTDGWRNLHQPHPCVIQAELTAEGRGVVTVERRWREDAAFEDSAAWCQTRGKSREPYAALGWDTAIRTHRPFLPYTELGTLLERPSEIYDALASVLGLDDLVEVQKRLQTARKAAQARVDEVTTRLAALLPRLDAAAAAGEARADACARALHGRRRDLDAVGALLDADTTAPHDPAVALLRRTHVVPPDTNAIAESARALREATTAVATLATTDTARARELATLLTRALEFHAAHQGADCPVCGAADRLSDAWRAETTRHVDALRLEANEADAAHQRLQRATTAARRLLDVAVQPLRQLADLGLETTAAAIDVVERWRGGMQLRDDQLADHLEREGELLRSTMHDVQQEVRAELARREDVWQPLAADVRRWLADARAAERHQGNVALLKKALDWFKNVQASVRQERFRPIAEHAIAIWEQLRQHSNVSLGEVSLEGASTQRRVELQVTVDEKPGAALSVMSQGELNALALSLFMPRAALPESPFRFMAIDDPVQSMDPSRVDGLARVLDAAAKRRQVIVFTHDDRLPESIRRLGIQATVLEVTRRPGSHVSARTRRSPVEGYLDDAHAIRLTKDLPPEVKRRVLPGFCRSAIEAACMETIRRRLLARGDAHADVEARLVDQRKLTELVALALFDDERRGGDVLASLNNRFGRWAGDVVQHLNRGAHGGFDGDLEDLTRHAEKLASSLRELA